MARGVVILECSKTPQSEVWARSCEVLNGALPKDSAQLCECCGEGQHTLRSDARESRFFGGVQLSEYLLKWSTKGVHRHLRKE